MPLTTKPSSVASISAPEAAQALDDGRDPVGLLDPQLARAADDGLGPRRSSPAAPRAAARRSPAAPRRRRRRCRTSGAAAHVEVADRLARAGAVARALPRGRRARCRPCAARCARSPCASSWAAPRDEQRASRARARRRRSRTRPRTGRRGRRTPRSVSSSALADASPRRRRGARHAGRGEHPLGVVAAGRGLDDRRRARRPISPASSDARLDLGAGDRQLVGDRRAAARR